MTAIKASEVNRRFGELLEGVTRGESYDIVRYGRVVARLVPPPKKEKPKKVDLPPEPQVSPQAQPPGTVGKITTRQQRVDDILNRSRQRG